MWNWIYEASEESKVSPEAIWQVWKDVEGWSIWDEELEYCRLEGPFTAGTEGMIKPKGWSPLKFTITEAKECRGFKDITKISLGTTLEFQHSVESLPSGSVRITHRVYARGLLAPMLRFTLRRKLRAKMPRALEALIRRAGEIHD